MGVAASGWVAVWDVLVRLRGEVSVVTAVWLVVGVLAAVAGGALVWWLALLTLGLSERRRGWRVGEETAWRYRDDGERADG